MLIDLYIYATIVGFLLLLLYSSLRILREYERGVCSCSAGSGRSRDQV